MESKYLDQLANRPGQLREAKKKGVKIVGFFPGNYVPEEMIYASGAIPVCLCDAGGPEAADAASSKVPSVICPFARAQIGERILKTNSYYNMIDMLIAPITCVHLKKAAEIWEFQADIEIFKLGVPHQYDVDFGLEYYAERLGALKDRLQKHTGNEITPKKLSEAIVLYNRMREMLRNISLLRRNEHPPITSSEFVKLNHASLYADPVSMVETLETVYKELQHREGLKKLNALRLLLIGPNVAYGDYKVLGLVEAAGTEIVAEEICEGMRYYWQEIENGSDLLQSLAKGYLIDRLPCAFMGASTKRRLDFALKLIEDFNVSGVIWYELLFCETYDSESYFFSQKLAERHIPMLVLESDYSPADAGQLKLRIEAFIEAVKGGM